MHGTSNLSAEVTHISKYGVWLLLEDEELLMPFAQFPWFRQATIDQLSNVERPTENYLYWPALDIDLSIESIRNPNEFPLVSLARRFTRAHCARPCCR